MGLPGPSGLQQWEQETVVSSMRPCPACIFKKTFFTHFYYYYYYNYYYYYYYYYFLCIHISFFRNVLHLYQIIVISVENLIGQWFFTRIGHVLRSESNYVTSLPLILMLLENASRTFRHTDIRRDRASYRDARTHLKTYFLCDKIMKANYIVKL